MSAAAQKTAESAAPAPERQVSVNGYIDAVTGDRIYGWAWDAQQPAAKIGIRLIAKDKIVGAFAANLPREDLKASGIGDGEHAFEVAIPDGVSAAEVKVLAVCPATGATVPLASRVIGAPADGGIQDIRNVVETLCKSHGFIHQKLQAISTAVAESRAAAKPRMDNAPADSDVSDEADGFAPLGRLQTLEEATVRLDALIKEQGARIALIHHQPADPLPKFLAAAAVVLSLAALLITLVQ